MSRRYKEGQKPNASFFNWIVIKQPSSVSSSASGGRWAATLEDTHAAPAGLAAKTAHEVRAALAPALLLRAGILPGRRRVAARRRRLRLDRYQGWRWRAGVVWRRPTHSHDHATLVTDGLHPLRGTPVCFSVSLCLSRACLGKLIVVSINWCKRVVLRTASSV